MRSGSSESTGGKWLPGSYINLEKMMSVRRQIDERIEALFREARGVADDTNVIPEMRRRMWRIMRLCDELSAVMGGNWTETEKTGIAQPEEVDNAAK